jgi:hypothetical protein
VSLPPQQRASTETRSSPRRRPFPIPSRCVTAGQRILLAISTTVPGFLLPRSRRPTQTQDDSEEPCHGVDEVQQFGYAGKVPGSGSCAPDSFDELNGLTVRVRTGRVSFIAIYQVTSC